VRKSRIVEVNSEGVKKLGKDTLRKGVWIE